MYTLYNKNLTSVIIKTYHLLRCSIGNGVFLYRMLIEDTNVLNGNMIKARYIHTVAYIQVSEVLIVVQCITNNKMIGYFKSYVYIWHDV